MKIEKQSDCESKKVATFVVVAIGDKSTKYINTCIGLDLQHNVIAPFSSLFSYRVCAHDVYIVNAFRECKSYLIQYL